jgi:hypothetical protein
MFPILEHGLSCAGHSRSEGLRRRRRRGLGRIIGRISSEWVALRSRLQHLHYFRVMPVIRSEDQFAAEPSSRPPLQRDIPPTAHS